MEPGSIKLLALIAVLAFIGAGFYFFIYRVNTGPHTGPIMNVPKSQLPDHFPLDIPIEAGAPILANYNIVNAKGQYQATRTFLSRKSAMENFNYYKNIVPALGWVLGLATPNYKGQAIITAAKNDNALNIRMYQDAAGASRVDISNILIK